MIDWFINLINTNNLAMGLFLIVMVCIVYPGLVFLAGALDNYFTKKSKR